MKGTSIALGVFDFVLFITTVAFGAQVGGQGGRATEVGVPQISTVVQAPQSSGPKDPMGFQHYGQYVAAKYVSENLNISPDALRTQMLDNHLSLGDAIKKLRPELSSKTVHSEMKKAEAAAKKAEAEARYEPIDHLPLRRSN